MGTGKSIEENFLRVCPCISLSCIFRFGNYQTCERIHGPATLEFQSIWAKNMPRKLARPSICLQRLRVDGENATISIQKPRLIPFAPRPYVKTITKHQTEEAFEQATAYKKWFTLKYLSNGDGISSTATMVDGWTWWLKYRDALKEYEITKLFNCSSFALP